MVEMASARELAPGSVVPDLMEANLRDGTAIRQAIESALGSVAGRSRDVIAILPDTSVRVVLLDFETLPSKRDEAEANFRTTRDGAEAARAQYEVALAGMRVEDRAAVTAELRRADGAVREVTSYVDENTLRSPLDGQVMVKVVEQGELVSPGLPLLTIVDLSDQWVTVNLREDRLAGLRVGDQFRATIPAVDAEPRPFTVYYISPLGSFATWRATREAGGFDVRTFEVRARPDGPIEGLRPGMSALIEWPGPRRRPQIAAP